MSWYSFYLIDNKEFKHSDIRAKSFTQAYEAVKTQAKTMNKRVHIKRSISEILKKYKDTGVHSSLNDKELQVTIDKMSISMEVYLLMYEEIREKQQCLSYQPSRYQG